MKPQRVVFLFIIVMAVAALAFAFACGDDDDDDDNLDDDDWNGNDDDDDTFNDGSFQNFMDALPDPESLLFVLPGMDETTTLALGETATTYEFTVDRAMDINDYILEMLSVIDEITSYNYTSFDGTTVVWGPWKQSGLSRVYERFTITNVEDNSYTYTLEWVDKDEYEADENTDDWVEIWYGDVEASTETERRGIGTFVIDYSAAKELWPERVDAEGSIDVDYDTMTDGRQIDMVFSNFLPDDIEIPLDGDYSFVETASLNGTLEFDAMVDLEDDQDNWEIEDDVAEHFWIVTQWKSSGIGRGDLAVTEGNIPDIHPDPPNEDWYATKFTRSECWDTNFVAVYYYEEIFWDNATSTVLFDDGDVNLCEFPQQMPDVS